MAPRALQNNRPLHVGLSRRQAMLGLAVGAAGLGWSKGWAGSPTNWPLWIVEARGQKVFLTGETPPRQNAWSDKRIEGLLSGCQALWTETNLVRHQDTQTLMTRYGIDTATPLLSKLTDADQKRLAQVAEMAKVPMSDLAQLKPWLAAMTLEQAYYGTLNLQESGSAEKVLMSKANDMGITISSEFPSIDDLVQFMGTSSQAEDVQYLLYTMDHILDGPAENERIYSLWARGDLSGAEGMVRRMQSSEPAMYRQHVVGRNRRWVPRIEDMLTQSKPSLIVVGLYHLAGPDSVLACLKEKGLKVTAA